MEFFNEKPELFSEILSKNCNKFPTSGAPHTLNENRRYSTEQGGRRRAGRRRRARTTRASARTRYSVGPSSRRTTAPVSTPASRSPASTPKSCLDRFLSPSLPLSLSLPLHYYIYYIYFCFCFALPPLCPLHLLPFGLSSTLC